MAQTPLMPKATAVWLVENTALTFDQIANFCNIHPLEVKGIADGDVAQGIRGMDPIMSGELTRLELESAEADVNHMLELNKSAVQLPVLLSGFHHFVFGFWSDCRAILDFKCRVGSHHCPGRSPFRCIG